MTASPIGEDGHTVSSPLLFGLVVASGALGTSSVAPALPSIARDLDLSLATTAAVVSAYTIPFATSTIIGGQLVDRYGPRRVLRPAAAIALAGLLLATSAGGAEMLLAGRAMQGIGAAMAAVTGYAVVRRLPNGLATAAAALTVGSAAGPLFGGIASQYLTWRAAVGLPIPLLLLALILAVPRDGNTKASDALGTMVVATGATLAAAALQFASVNATITATLLPVAFGLLVFAGRRTLRGRGLVPSPALLRAPRLRMMGVLGMVTAATYFATIIIAPVGLGATGWGPIGIGLLLLPPAVSGALSSRGSHVIASRLRHWTEPTAAALILLSVTLVVLSPPIVGALSITILATAFGMVQPRLMAEVAEAVRTGPATALGTANLIFLLGGGIGAATVGGLGATGGGMVLLVAVLGVGLMTLRHTLVGTKAAGLNQQTCGSVQRRSPPKRP